DLLGQFGDEGRALDEGPGAHQLVDGRAARRGVLGDGQVGGSTLAHQLDHRGGVGGDPGQGDLHGSLQPIAALPGGQEEAGGQPAHVQVESAGGRFVEVVDVVVDQAILGLEGAVVLAVEVADEVQLGPTPGEQGQRCAQPREDVGGEQL